MTSRSRRAQGNPPLRAGSSPLPKRTRFNTETAIAAGGSAKMVEPKPAPKVGDRFDQRCGYTDFVFIYEITEITAPDRFKVKMVGIKEP